VLAGDDLHGGKVPHLTDQAIYDILKRRAGQAGLETFSPHDIRRTFAGNLLDAGVDLATVQRLMGHSDPATTAGYDRRSETVKKDAVSRLTIPIISDIVDYTKTHDVPQ
jgi:site-specific recombinase XerD